MEITTKIFFTSGIVSVLLYFIISNFEYDQLPAIVANTLLTLFLTSTVVFIVSAMWVIWSA